MEAAHPLPVDGDVDAFLPDALAAGDSTRGQRRVHSHDRARSGHEPAEDVLVGVGALQATCRCHSSSRQPAGRSLAMAGAALTSARFSANHERIATTSSDREWRGQPVA